MPFTPCKNGNDDGKHNINCVFDGWIICKVGRNFFCELQGEVQHEDQASYDHNWETDNRVDALRDRVQQVIELVIRESNNNHRENCPNEVGLF